MLDPSQNTNKKQISIWAGVISTPCLHMSLLTVIVSSDRWFWVRINIYKVEKYIWGTRCWLHDAVCLVYVIFQTVVFTGKKQLTSVQGDEKVRTVAEAHLDSPSHQRGTFLDPRIP